MKNLFKPAPVLLTGLVLGTLLTLVATGFADGDPTTDAVPRTLPYQGTVELNGQPVHATGGEALAMRFLIYDSADAAEPVYAQDIDVEIFAGRFTATIGPSGLDPNGASVPIADVISAADDLHLGVALLNELDNPDDDVLLSNRQRLHASPYAMWTTSATSFAVANTLSVGDSLRVGGSAHIGTGRPVSGLAQLKLANNPSSGAPSNFNDYQLLLHQNSAPASSVGLGVQSDGTLFMNTPNDVAFYEDGQLRLHMDSDVLRVPVLSASGDIAAGGNIAAVGTISGDFQLSTGPEVNATRNNSDGNDQRVLGSTNNRFCFLTKVAFRDVDSGDEYGECRVFASSGQWYLRAHLNNTGDADAYCTARCISW